MALPHISPVSLLSHIGKLLDQTAITSQWINYFLFNLQSHVGDSVYMRIWAHSLSNWFKVTLLVNRWGMTRTQAVRHQSLNHFHLK